ncbi:MAG: ferrochelatase [Bacillus sp. (in: firmicutes)]
MIGVIYFAYGAPNSLDHVEGFFTHMMNGKTPSPQMVEGLQNRFRQFGTVDPLSAVTKRQARGLQMLLSQSVNEEVKVYNAYKHTAPFVNDVVKEMIEDGVKTIVTLPSALLFSKSGTGAFQAEVRQIVGSLGAEATVVDADSWHTHPALVAVLADRVKSAYEWLPESARKHATVLFTVHSQPVNPSLNEGYVKQYHELADAIAGTLQLPKWQPVYRSLHNKETWLGPDVLDVIREEAKQGTKGIVTCELLSVIADVEVFFEIGEDCQKLSNELGLEFAHAEFLNDSFDFVHALSVIVKEKLEAAKVSI